MTTGRPKTSQARCGGAAGVVNQAVANQRTATSQHQGHTPPRAALQAPDPTNPPTVARHCWDTARPCRTPARGLSCSTSSTQGPEAVDSPTQPPL